MYHTDAYAMHDHRPGDCEHPCADAQDEALCLCQLRTQCFLSKLCKTVLSVSHFVSIAIMSGLLYYMYDNLIIHQLER